MKDKTEKIRKLADLKSQRAVDKTLKAIDELLKEGRNITFYNVYTKAGVSKSFVYNNDKVRNIIESYRTDTPTTDVKMNTKDSIILIQKKRIKELELKMKNYDELTDKLKKLQQENVELKAQLRKAYEY